MTARLYTLYTRRLRRQVRSGPLPAHVGIVMDGNRRWARHERMANPSLGLRSVRRKPAAGIGWPRIRTMTAAMSMGGGPGPDQAWVAWCSWAACEAGSNWKVEWATSKWPARQRAAGPARRAGPVAEAGVVDDHVCGQHRQVDNTTVRHQSFW